MGLFSKQPKMDPIAMAQAQRAREEQEVTSAFQKGITALRDFIAPASLEFSSSSFRIGTRLARTYYVYGYPRQIYTGWLSSMVNLDEIMDLSIFVYPVESQVVLENLRKKVGQLEAGLQIDAERGKVRDQGNKRLSLTPRSFVTSYKSAKKGSLGLVCTSRFTASVKMSLSS